MKQELENKRPDSEERRSIWQRWKQNLKDWVWFCKEHPDWLDLDVQTWVSTHIGQPLRRRWQRLRELRHQNRQRQLPETEWKLGQLLLFLWGSLPRMGSDLRERLTRRRKGAIRSGGRMRAFFEGVKLHPAVFVAGAVAVTAVAVCLSMYTIGATARYDGVELGTVRSAHSVSAAVDQLEEITRQTLSDTDYSIDSAKLEVRTGIVPRKELESTDALEENLTQQLGLVDYAYVLYVEGEPVAATTFPGAIEQLLEQLKKGYITGKGYIVHTAPYVTVVGGVNMDIGGWPGEVPVMQDSNPGVVRMSLGGVGRNIAHNMALLGMDVRLLTVFGDDINAQKIAASCGELGIDISQSPIIPEGRTSTYLFITDEKGDMALAVSDMEIYKHLTPQLLAQRQTLLNASQAVVLDTNIPAESIEWLADHCAAPLFADPVSTAKAVKLKPVLGKLHTLKPNRIEAELLSGVKITDDASLRKAAETLLDTGLHRVFISLGSDGVFAADRSGQQVQLPPLPGAMVNTTGCGDAFMAAITWAYLQGTDLTDTAKAGLAASVIAMESAETINPAMSEDTLRQRAALSN